MKIQATCHDNKNRVGLFGKSVAQKVFCVALYHSGSL